MPWRTSSPEVDIISPSAPITLDWRSTIPRHRGSEANQNVAFKVKVIVQYRHW